MAASLLGIAGCAVSAWGRADGEWLFRNAFGGLRICMDKDEVEAFLVSAGTEGHARLRPSGLSLVGVTPIALRADESGVAIGVDSVNGLSTEWCVKASGWEVRAREGGIQTGWSMAGKDGTALRLGSGIAEPSASTGGLVVTGAGGGMGLTLGSTVWMGCNEAVMGLTCGDMGHKWALLGAIVDAGSGADAAARLMLGNKSLALMARRNLAFMALSCQKGAFEMVTTESEGKTEAGMRAATDVLSGWDLDYKARDGKQ